MEITVNQQNYHFTDTCSIEQMLAVVLNAPANGIAVAINQTIVSKAQWPVHVLHNGDQVLLIKATQGG